MLVYILRNGNNYEIRKHECGKTPNKNNTLAILSHSQLDDNPILRHLWDREMACECDSKNEQAGHNLKSIKINQVEYDELLELANKKPPL